MDKKPEKLVPEVRFKGFTDDWEHRKLENVFTKYQKRINPTQQNLELWSLTIDQGLVAKTKRYDRSFLVRKNDIFNLVPKGYFVYNPMNITLGTIDVNKYHSIAVSGYYIVLKSNDQFNVAFLASLLHTSSMINKYKRFSTGSLLEKQRLQFPNFAKVKIISPRLSEQTKIGLLMNQINNLIDLQQRKLELLKQLKKAMLQQLFADKNSKQPNLRFKKFKGDWEQRKLGTVGKAQSGIGFPNKEQGGQKGVPFFKVSDMNNNGNEFEMTTSNNYVTEQQIISKKWKTITKVPAVIFAKVGAALMLNRKRLVTVPFLIDNNTMAYIFSKNWDPYFGKVLFDTLNLPKYAQTGALPSFNGSDIENIKVMFPNQVEQQIIGCFFESINGLITHQQNRLTQLTALKKYLLQKLFI
ncbi:restriction endonuclease subunit S [Limosilactobacillus reuteri]|uniref:Restriction endonuclease subunit S n=1 Tax=Limosilactobacillus reuteri TaxID=1598 RepID=A0A7L6BI22_LIMRT|nr:restriction endonuclease subunit S [Limosilactobacillus reuteri]QLQ61867.1 restriction endonuclease subunit S [Limosilactobacillus reuteri]